MGNVRPEDAWFSTLKGQQFYYLRPRAMQIDPEEIAHSLAHLCRYNGHCRAFYSVAEHSVLMADWMAQQPGVNDRMVLTTLLHDAAEAYIGDMPRPLKQIMPDFERAESLIEQAVSDRFGTYWPLPVSVKEADARILVDEKQQVMSANCSRWHGDALPPLGIQVMHWPPHQAKDQFLAALETYSGIHIP